MSRPRIVHQSLTNFPSSSLNPLLLLGDSTYRQRPLLPQRRSAKTKKRKETEKSFREIKPALTTASRATKSAIPETTGVRTAFPPHECHFPIPVTPHHRSPTPAPATTPRRCLLNSESAFAIFVRMLPSAQVRPAAQACPALAPSSQHQSTATPHHTPHASSAGRPIHDRRHPPQDVLILEGANRMARETSVVSAAIRGSDRGHWPAALGASGAAARVLPSLLTPLDL